MQERLTVEQVKTAIRQFWTIFCSKDSRKLMRFYAGHATVFSSSSNRHELGPMSAARRQREYFHGNASVSVQLGPIEVTVLGEHGESAVASYTFEFHATNVATLSGAIEENIQHGRATQVFSRDVEGGLIIMHEHLSLPARVERRSDHANGYFADRPLATSFRAR